MQTAKKNIREALSSLYEETEVQSISRLLLSKVTGYDFTGLLVNKNTIFSEKQTEVLDNYLEKLKKGEPLQYVLGETEFCGLHFDLDPNVLIPRQETEELVEWVATDAFGSEAMLDIGTGSGCIAISLQHFLPRARVFACDVSEGALRLAEANAGKLGKEVNFFLLDVLQVEKHERSYDIIVSNPPYIPRKEKAEMEKKVTDFEPGLALFVQDDDPLLFYRSIARFARKYLRSGGHLYFEIHRDFGTACVELLQSMNFRNVIKRKDILGNDRMVRATMD